jgi:hypothetical protein
MMRDRNGKRSETNARAIVALLAAISLDEADLFWGRDTPLIAERPRGCVLAGATLGAGTEGSGL